MSDPKDTGDWQYKGPALDASGKLVGDRPKPRPSAPPTLAPKPEPEQKLELDVKRLPHPTSWSDPAPYRDDYKKALWRSFAFRASAVFIALGVIALVAFMLMPRLQHDIPWNFPGAAAHSLLITSEPSGADIRINGNVVGQTPFAADNRWVGHTAIELRLEGYEPFRDHFEGAHDAHIAATLRKKVPPP